MINKLKTAFCKLIYICIYIIYMYVNLISWYLFFFFVLFLYFANQKNFLNILKKILSEKFLYITHVNIQITLKLNNYFNVN